MATRVGSRTVTVVVDAGVAVRVRPPADPDLLAVVLAVARAPPRVEAALVLARDPHVAGINILSRP